MLLHPADSIIWSKIDNLYEKNSRIFGRVRDVDEQEKCEDIVDAKERSRTTKSWIRRTTGDKSLML